MTHNDLRYGFGPYELDPGKRILTRDGEAISLTPKATEILLVLVKHAGQLVEKDELLKEVWPDTFVEEANLSQNIFTLRRALGDDRTGAKYIETIARRGYRFTSSVQTIGPDEYEPKDSFKSDDDITKRPVVVVLPFSNHTGEAELDYLADGLTENIINNLSRISQLRVMSHTAVFRYKSAERDPQQIGKELRANANPAAYQAYLEGRFHWSRYTRKEIEKAIEHFRRAIDLDPNYALAYAAIVDCYLRLATNYLPPEVDGSTLARLSGASHETDQIELGFEWDCRSVERELRRADELKTGYPSPHQWHFAYIVSKQLYRESFLAPSTMVGERNPRLASQIPSVQLTPAEEVQILCSVARDQITIGNFEAANLILRRWTVPRKWPRLALLNPCAAADLLFTLGTLFGSVAGSSQVLHGHKRVESFLNGSIALFTQLGIESRSSEARIELARCYYKQGLFDLGRESLSEALSELPNDQIEIKSFGLLVWGAIERDAGRLKDSLSKLRQAASLEGTGPLASGRCYPELATTLKELANAECDEQYSDEAALHFQRALYKFEAVGHHRFVAAIENNMGFLLSSLGLLEESEQHLLRSKRLFDSLSDGVHGAQTNETLARLYLENKQFALAEEVIDRAVKTLELTDGEAALAESLTTPGVIAAKQCRYSEAKKSFEAAFRVAERCGDHEGAGRALLFMFEEVNEGLDLHEKVQILERLKRLLGRTQEPALQARVEKCIKSYEQQ
jgi:DNA-binding winged helix-turn-helix (wHTH) protein/Tfp pilus assembly protein PilF